MLPEWGEAAQLALSEASVLVIGAGGLGSPVALYLAGAGVGRLGIVDDDVVEVSNLHRQPLHFTPDLGESKAESAAAKLRFLNPDIARRAVPDAASTPRTPGRSSRATTSSSTARTPSPPATPSTPPAARAGSGSSRAA